VLLIWIFRLLLLAVFIPLVVPWALLLGAFSFTMISGGLTFLALILIAFAVFVGLLRGVLGPLVDFFLVIVLISLLWHWPRGVRATFAEKTRLAFRSLHNATCHQLRQCSMLEFLFCIAIVLLALVLSLSSGFFYLLVTVIVVLLLISLIGRWPHGPQPFERKLRMALDSLWKDLRNRFS